MDAEILEVLAEGAINDYIEQESKPATTNDPLVGKLKQTVIRALKHNSSLSTDEPNWGTVNVRTLPQIAFISKTDSKYPHHWIKDGLTDERGYYTQGELYLHKEAMNLSWRQACIDKNIFAQAHLRKHMADIGVSYKDIAYLADITESQLKELDTLFVKSNLLTIEDLDIKPVDALSKYIL